MSVARMERERTEKNNLRCRLPEWGLHRFLFFRQKEVKKMIIERQFYGARELSRLTGISENYIRRGIKDGTVPGFYSGSWFRVDAKAYLEQISQQHEGGAINGTK